MSESLFVKILIALFGLAAVYGTCVTVLLLSIDDPSDAVLTRFIGSFAGIFGGLLGFCTGYLAGTRNGRRNGNGSPSEHG